MPKCGLSTNCQYLVKNFYFILPNRSVNTKENFTLKFLLILSFVISSYLAIAQSLTKDSIQTQNGKSEKGYDLTIMPFFNYNRNLKFMFGVIPMVMYRANKADTISPKSLSGVAATYTTNKSYFIAIFNRIYFAEDRWRAILYGVTGNQNSQFYMDDADIPGFYDYGTEMTVIGVGIQRRLVPGVFGGVTYSYSNYYTEYEDEVQPPSTTITNGIEFNIQYDIRDDVYYPTIGKKAKIRWISNPEWFANDFKSNRIKSEYNQYFPMRSGIDVIAARFAGSFGLGTIAFEQQVTIGGKDIRGYSEGKYRGDGLMAVQGEYRYNFNKRMGLVGFFGLATLYGSDTEDFNWGIYPGIGVGYRYKAFKNVKFNIGLDAAVGKDDWGFYFRIGEAF
mgnify:CR=1 FL=1